MCGKVAQWLRFWAVNHDTKGSNPAETIYIFYFCWHAYSLHKRWILFLFSPNVLLKLQTSSHKIVMEHSTFVSICWFLILCLFRRNCLSSLLTYISALWRLSGISENRRSIGWFYKQWKWRVVIQRKSRFRLDEPKTRAKNKGHTIVMHVFNELLLRS